MLGALPRAAEALSLTPPLPRVKFLLMDAGDSPQAETRWSDPITLHQGSTGEGVSWLQSVPYTLHAKWSCSAAPSTLTPILPSPIPPPPLPWDWVPGSSVQIWRSLHTDTGAGGGALALSNPTCLPLLGAQAPAQSWAAAAFPSDGEPARPIAGGKKGQSKEGIRQGPRKPA